jgi:CDP-4-dehydro-6-deoxyglucose reductase, E1
VSQPNYPLATSTWDAREIEAMNEVMREGQFTMGPRVAEFERQFAEYLGVPYCVMTSSGSTANLIMTAALFFRSKGSLARGDEVIVPAVSWATTYYPLHQYGLRLKFVDVDRETLNYDLDALKSAVTDRTRLLVAVNLLGNPNDFSVLQELVDRHQITLIEDNCEALGAQYGGRAAGTFGLMGSFSFFYSHHITTMEGGAVCTADEELYHILLSLRAHGWTRELPDPNWVTGGKSADPFDETFRFVLPGYNVRPLELSGAVGIEQLGKLNMIVEGRRRNAEVFRQHFGSSQTFAIQKELGLSSWFGFSLVLRAESPVDRASVLRALQDAGIEYRPIVAGDFTQNPVLRWIDHEVHGDLPNASSIHARGFFVGNQHRDLTSELTLLSEALSPF